jgi:cold shock CspA family protein
MTDSSPSAETIRLVTKIFSARPIPIAEISTTIAGIHRALRQLGQAATTAITREPVQPAIAPRPRAAAPKPAAPAPPFTPVRVAEKPRRGRPPRVVAVAPEPEAIAAPEPQPRLLRRAEAMANEHEHHIEPHAVMRTPTGTLRGVVKWYDGRAGKGALRLTGVSGDVLLDPAVLARSGIKRLYKDQEIEATVQDSAGRVCLVSLSLPSRNNEPMLNTMAGEVTGMVRRHPRSVTVEVKRDGIRQSAARAEAEQVLGGVGRPKIGRRLTP